jgi:hypothetical protein
MRMRSVSKALLAAGACALIIALAPAMSEAQTKSKAKAKITVPENGCLIAGAALNHGETCAAPCSAEQWCPVNWCVMGKLEQTVFNCYEPSGLCTPKC